MKIKDDAEPKMWDRLFATPGILAIITTVDAEGRINAGAFATCVRATHNPMQISFITYANLTDTGQNIIANGQFVVNLPSHDPAMLQRICTVGLPFASDVNELEVADLTAIPAVKVKPPRVAECNRHFECEVIWTKEWDDRLMIMGKVVAASADRECTDEEGFVDLAVANPTLYCGAQYFNRPPFEHLFVAASDTMRVQANYQGPELEEHLSRVNRHK